MESIQWVIYVWEKPWSFIGYWIVLVTQRLHPVSWLRGKNLCLIMPWHPVLSVISTFPVSSIAPLLVMELCQRPYYRRNRRRVYATLRNMVGPGAVSPSLANLGFMCQYVFLKIIMSALAHVCGGMCIKTLPMRTDMSDCWCPCMATNQEHVNSGAERQ